MYKIAATFFCLFISATAANAQKYNVSVNYVLTDGSHNNSEIFYDGKYKLKWDDFKAPPCEDCPEAALTNAGMGFNFTFSSNGKKTSLIINVYCDFDKSKSWVRSIGRNDYILKHEQDHWDISYICTMHFVQKLQKADITADNYNDVLTKLYKETVQEMHDMQTQYDDETNHSIIKDKQEAWDVKIAKMLADLKN